MRAALAAQTLTVLAGLVSARGQSVDPSARFTAVVIKTAYSDEPASAQAFFGRASWWGGRCAGAGPKKIQTVPASLAGGCAVTFANLLGHAYHLNAAQFTPDKWMESSWFRIQGKAPPGATEDQYRRMEQNLLADTFGLSAHLEKREVVNYELSVTKGGAKFHRPEKEPPFPGSASLTVGFGINGTMLLMGDTVTLDRLASFLSFYSDWPVVDATGLAGAYQIRLERNSVIAGLGQAPPIVESVRDQLGLILERTKTVMDVLVIDHVEKRPAAP